MDKRHLEDILRKYKSGEMEEKAVLEALRDFPTAELGFANLDSHRSLRQGFPEVVFGQGKTAVQVLSIVKRLAESHRTVLATRLSEEAMDLLRRNFPQGEYFTAGRAVIIGEAEKPVENLPIVAVFSAGTSDAPVVEEAAATLKAMGVKYQAVYDVGVAGIHRILKYRELLQEAGAAIVIAGMEGALASMVGGLTAAPVIAVPTSVGYGAAFQGLAALLGMLNSCAAGVMVVNIDNGFGAAAAAARIVKAGIGS